MGRDFSIMNYMSDFYERYKQYKDFPIANLKHIPEISCYNHNYYLGLKRNGMVSEDLIFEETDESIGVSEYYHILGDTAIHIGYSYCNDDYITLQEEEQT